MGHVVGKDALEHTWQGGPLSVGTCPIRAAPCLTLTFSAQSGHKELHKAGLCLQRHTSDESPRAELCVRLGDVLVAQERTVGQGCWACLA